MGLVGIYTRVYGITCAGEGSVVIWQFRLIKIDCAAFSVPYDKVFHAVLTCKPHDGDVITVHDDTMRAVASVAGTVAVVVVGVPVPRVINENRMIVDFDHR